MRRFGALVAYAIALTALAAGTATAADQLVAGKLLLVENPKPADPSKRKIVYFGKENLSDETVVGDPTANGAHLNVKLDSTTQCFAMPSSGWTPISTIGFKYKDATGANGPVKVAFIKRTPGGVFLNKVVILGQLGSITVVPPNPGVLGDTNFKIGGGDSYCSEFPGAFANPNDAKTFKVKNALDDVGCGVSACSPSGAFLDQTGGLF